MLPHTCVVWWSEDLLVLCEENPSTHIPAVSGKHLLKHPLEVWRTSRQIISWTEREPEGRLYVSWWNVHIYSHSKSLISLWLHRDQSCDEELEEGDGDRCPVGGVGWLWGSGDLWHEEDRDWIFTPCNMSPSTTDCRRGRPRPINDPLQNMMEFSALWIMIDLFKHNEFVH